MLVLLLFSARASGTLTIGQIFNFEVGDTFDYANVSILYNAPPQYNSFSYSRYAITSKVSFSDSVIYIRQRLYPSLQIETLKYGGLSNSILYLDTGISNPVDSFATGISNWDSLYNRDYKLEFEGSWTRQYESGLGITYSETQGWGDIVYKGYQSLIYYSRGASHAGTPYYTFTTGINDISDQSIRLYPTPTSDILHLSYSEASQHNAHLIITGLLGQQVYSSPITESESIKDISALSAGIYTWRLSTEQGVIKTGKVVKQ